jgi:hypothetical protein
MFRIGIDFDNTIACYDQAFDEVAILMGLSEPGQLALSKVGTKAQILARPNGDVTWQRLQGKVYGKYMLLADVFPGFHEFLYLSKLRGYKVFVVSHKSEFGHFDEERIPLREQALVWLEHNEILHKNEFNLHRQDIFFETTREEKIHKICELGCTHFVDDLREVFEEPLFPTDVNKILFRPSPAIADVSDASCTVSWRQLTSQFFGAWTQTEIRDVARMSFPDLDVSHVEQRRGRGNSRVFKLTSNLASDYLLKIYPDRQLDSRPRLETEFAACQELISRMYPVAAPIAADKNLGWSLFKWVEGDSIECPDEQFLTCASDFIQRLNFDSHELKAFDQFSLASEACLSGAEVVRQIQQRIHKLLKIESDALKAFLDQEYVPYFTLVTEVAREKAGQLFDVPLERSLQIPSPSDFGSHNALRDTGGRVTFIDFEYFGWDDPVKLVSDFYWHPGMSLSDDLRRKWIEKSLSIFKKDKTYPQRLDAYLPLFGLRWCAIILNEYLKPVAASQIPEGNICEGSGVARTTQLLKAKNLLQTVKETVNVYG